MSGQILSLSLKKCTVSPPSLPAWAYAISVHSLCCIVGGVPCGILLFYLLTKNPGGQKANPETHAQSNKTIKPIVGVFVGVLASAMVFIGRPAIESYSPSSKITFIGPLLASTFGFTTLFKSINVAFRQYPEGADSDLQTWLIWFVMTPEPTFVKAKLSKANWKEFVVKIREFFFKICALFILISVLIQLGNPPYYQVMKEKYPSSSSYGENDRGDDNTFFKWFLSTHVNGFLHLWLLYLFFSFCLDFSTIVNFFLSGGLRMEPAFCNPLLGSRSFKETWGIRWNRPVNLLLKRTVYIPARKSGLCNKNLSATLTFFASGLLHEYNFSVHNNLESALVSGYRPGEVTMFFLFMGMLMICESWIWNRCFPHWLQLIINHLPSAITASVLTFVVSGLSERYFLRGCFESGFGEAVAQLLPHLDCR